MITVAVHADRLNLAKVTCSGSDLPATTTRGGARFQVKCSHCGEWVDPIFRKISLHRTR